MFNDVFCSVEIRWSKRNTFSTLPLYTLDFPKTQFYFIRIEESYQDVVGSKVAEFESHLHTQLVNTINTKPENIINLKTWPGSIEVELIFNL